MSKKHSGGSGEKVGETDKAVPGGDQAQYGLSFQGWNIPLARGQSYVVGRDKAQCDIVIDDGRISSQHARVSYKDGRFYVEDLGSLNGTFVNSQKVTDGAAVLSPGDEIFLPPHQLQFVDMTALVPSPPQPEKSNERQRNFEGVLATLRMPDLIQFLNLTRQGGVLTVRATGNYVARLFFLRGEVVAASYLGQTGEEAVYAAMTIPDGKFEFVPEDLTPPKNRITRSTESLLMEGTRRMDESGAEMAPTPTRILRQEPPT